MFNKICGSGFWFSRKIECNYHLKKIIPIKKIQTECNYLVLHFSHNKQTMIPSTIQIGRMQTPNTNVNMNTLFIVIIILTQDNYQIANK